MKSKIIVSAAVGLMMAAGAVMAEQAKDDTICLKGKMCKEGTKCVLKMADGCKVDMPADACAKCKCDCAGQDVKVTGKGKISQTGDQKNIQLDSVTAIEPVAPAQAAPAAPAAPAEGGPEATGPLSGQGDSEE